MCKLKENGNWAQFILQMKRSLEITEELVDEINKQWYELKENKLDRIHCARKRESDVTKGISTRNSRIRKREFLW